MDSLVGWNDELALAVEKPDAGEQVTVTPVEGQGLDLSAIAALNAQFYQSGSDLWLVFEDGAILVVEGYFEGTTETADGTPRSVIVDGETFTGAEFMTAFSIDDLPEEFAEGETGDSGPQQNSATFDDPSLGDLGGGGQGIGLLGNSNRFGTGDTGTGGGGDRQDTDPTLGAADLGFVDEDGIVTDGQSVFTGSLAVNFGNNNDDTPDSADLQDLPTGAGNRSITFDSADVGSAVPLTSGGTPLTFVLSNGGTVLTASANGVPVFEVRLFDDGEGSYRFTLLGPIDHPDPTSEDDLDLTFSFTATDDDGDSVGGTFTVTVNDDVPEVGENARIIIDDDDVGTDGNPGIRNNPMDGAGTDDVPANTTGTLDLSFGADGGSVVWVPEDVTTSGGAEGLRFTTGEDGSLLILQNQNGEEVTVATITLNRTTGEYTVTQNNPLIHRDDPANRENDQDFVLAYRVTDGDGDAAEGTIRLTIDDDTPVVVSSNNARIIIDDDDVGTDGNPGIRNNPMDGAGTDDVPANTSGTLDLSFGADGGSVVWVPEDVTTSGGADGLRFTTGEDGSLLILQNQNGEEVIVATITLNRETGEYTVTQNNPLIHRDDPANRENDQDFVLAYRVTDGDGDTAEGTIRLTIDDDTPVARGSGTLDVFEDGTADGVFIKQSADGTLLFNGGADGAAVSTITYRFGGAVLDQDDGEFVALTSGNEPVDVATSEDGLTVTGRVGEQLIFTLEVTDPNTGAYTFMQFAPIDHPDEGESGTQDYLRLVFDFTVTDGDGDTATSWVQVDINDDAPEVSDNNVVQLDDDALGGNPGGVGDADPDTANTTGTLGLAFGADGVGGVVWDDAASTTEGGATGFDFGLEFGNENTLLITQDGTVVLRVTILDPSTGDYRVTQEAPIRHAEGQDENDQSFTLTYVVTDGDGDSANGILTIRVNDDSPVIDTSAVDNNAVEETPDTVGIATGELGIAWGADNANPTSGGGRGDVSLSFGNTIANLQAQALESHDKPLSYVVLEGPDGPVLIGYTDDRPDTLPQSRQEALDAGVVFGVGLEDTGVGFYEFVLFDTLDHPDPTTADVIKLAIEFVATDADGDTATGSFTIDVIDDVPVVSPVQAEAVGEEFFVNGVPDDIEQQNADVTPLVGGGFVITWQSGTSSADFDIRARIFDADGNEVVPDFLVNQLTTRGQQNPSVTGLPNGGFVITWESADRGQGDTSGTAIKARVFEADGTPAGDEFRVNTTTQDPQADADVTVLADGGFIITWQDVGLFSGRDNTIRARLFDADGTPAGDDFVINGADVGSDGGFPSVSALSNGGFVVTWQAEDADGGTVVLASVFNASGIKVVPDFVVNDITTGGEGLPDITALEGGGFVVTWESGGFFTSSAKARVFDASGQEIVSEFLVSENSEESQTSPVVTALADGGFVITWQSFDSFSFDNNVKARVFNAAGEEVVSEFLVSESAEGSQAYPVVTALPDGGFVVTWQTIDGFLDDADVKARIFRFADTLSVDEADISDGGSASVSGTLGVNFGADGFGSSVFTGVFSVAGGETLSADSEGVVSGLTSSGEPILFRLVDGGKRIEGYIEGSGDLVLEVSLDPNTAGWTLTLHGAVDHEPGFTGQGGTLPLSLTVAAADGDGDLVEVVLNVGIVDDDPVANADQVTTNEDTSVVINVLANDEAGADGVDPTDGGITIASGPSHGLVQINDDGTITYTPDENYSGDDSFTYILTDGDGDTSTAAVNVTVDPVADAPIVTIEVEKFDVTPVPVTGDIQANTTTAGFQQHSAITALKDGGFLVTWISPLAEGPVGRELHGQRFDASGLAVGDETLIATIPQNTFDNHSAALDDGGFVVTWTSIDPGLGDENVSGQRFDASGMPVGPEFLVNTTTEGTQTSASVITLNDGGFVVTWLSSQEDNTGSVSLDLLGQRYDGSGLPSGDEFRINPEPDDFPVDSSAAALADGGFIVTWTSLDTSIGRFEVYGQRFDAVGAPMGESFRVTDIDSGGVFSSVAALRDGGFVITWTGQDDSGLDVVYGQRYDVSGTPDTASFLVATNGSSTDGSVVALSDGGFLITWTGPDGDGVGIYGQRYGASGAPIGEAFRLNETVEGRQLSETLYLGEPTTVLAGGTLVSTWSGEGEVLLRLFDLPSGNPKEDEPFDLNVFVAVADPSETIDAVTLSGLPDEFVITDGVNSATSNGFTPVDITGWSLGDLTVIPAADWNGDLALEVSATSRDGTDTATTVETLTVIIDGVNDAPVAVDDTASGDEDTVIMGSVLSNDTDVDGDDLTVVAETKETAHGVVTINDDGSYSYAPNPDFNGTDSFTYTLLDGEGGQDTATVTITVDPVNDDPVAVDDAATGDEDTIITGTVLGNDSDIDGDNLTTVAETKETAHGRVIINSDGSYSYTPDQDFNGTDSFTYTVQDGQGGQDTATVTITVDPVNDDPVAVDDTASTDEDTVVSVNAANGLLANDSDVEGDTLTITQVESQALTPGAQITLDSGALLTVNADGSYSYDPNGAFESLGAGEQATDSFTYTIEDGQGGEATATASVTVNGVNDAPLAEDDAASTDEDTEVVVGAADGLLANDSDVEGDTLTITQINGEDYTPGDQITLDSGALLTVNADGSYSYTPADDFNGTDSFTYTLSDGTLTDEGTATITVNAVNDAPVAVDDTTSGDEDTVIIGNVLDNDTDVDGDELSVVPEAKETANGTVTINADGSYTYTPAVNFSGTDSFSYTVEDGEGGEDTGTVTVTVNPVADAPLVTLVVDIAPQPVTGDIRVNNRTDGFQSDSSIVALSNGGFVVTWFNQNSDGSRNVFGRVFDALGEPEGSSFRINSNVDVFRSEGAVAALDDGGFVVTWTAFQGQDGNLAGVYGQRYDASGNPEGREFRVNTETDGDQVSSSVTALEGGGFVVTWSSDFQDGSFLGVFGQLYAADGIPVGDEFQVNVQTSGSQSDSSVAGLPDGGFIITWSSPSAVGDGTIIYARRFDASGTPLGGEFQVSAATPDFREGSDVAVLSDGGFIITWSSDAADGSGYTIYARLYDASGQPVGEAFPVNPQISEDSVNSSVVALPDGGFAVIWSQSDQDGNGRTIYGQRYTASGLRVGDAFLFNEAMDGDDLVLTAPNGDSIAVLSDGTLVGTWSGGSSSDVFVRLFDGSASAPEDQPFDLNIAVALTDPSETITEVRLSGLPDGFEITDGVRTTISDGTPIDLVGWLLDDLTVTPAVDWNGELTLEVSATSTDGPDTATTVETLTVSIDPVNDAPVAVDDTVSTDEDTVVSVNAANGLLANDSDVEGDALTITQVEGQAFIPGDQITLGSGALLTVNADGSYTYDPNGAFESQGDGEQATDSFTYTIEDGQGGETTATATVTVNGLNDAPVAEDDADSTDEDTEVVVGAADGLLANDSDVEGETLTITQINGEDYTPGDQITLDSGALLTVNADGSYSYTPADDFNGNDSFTYTVSDGTLTDEGTATITVNAVNDAPVISGLSEAVSLEENAAGVLVSTFAVFDVDTADGLSFRVLNEAGEIDDRFDVVPADGTSVGQPGNYQLRLKPGVSFDFEAESADGDPTITLTVEVDDGASTNSLDARTITVEVADVNDAPRLMLNTFAVDNVRDDFESRDYEGNQGSQNWSTSWTETGDDGLPTGPVPQLLGTDIDIGIGGLLSGDPFNQSLSLSDRVRYPIDFPNSNGDNQDAFIQRSVDLSGAQSATLSFDYRSMMDQINDEVLIQISDNSTSGFVTLLTLNSENVAEEYTRVSLTSPPIYRRQRRSVS